MRKYIGAAAIVLGLATAVPAQAGFDFSTSLVTVADLGSGNYSFSQGGWSNGAAISGTFAGLDDDNDGFLDFSFGEISDFTMSFSGNAQVDAFVFDFSNLFALVYELDGGPLGDGCGCSFEEITAISAGFDNIYAANVGTFDACGVGDSCSLVASVPEPSNWALLIAGFGLVGATLRHRRGYRAA